ncbi:MAG: hypothetical protein NC180_12120 [Muribaculaceae bacterium]|nr:hypothetical protein [Roseburia sp.]MCM1432185.1 hypothetical protein [Muribaculaceae bacterium]MCM1493948.1 hypothetical protein [Muribaculaceae bacterium]
MAKINITIDKFNELLLEMAKIDDSIKESIRLLGIKHQVEENWLNNEWLIVKK